MSSAALKDPDSHDEIPRVVLTQTLCKIEQVFVYKIPPMKNAHGHRAEDWDLAKPAATCSLQLVQRDNTLEIQLLGHRPKQPAGSSSSLVQQEEFLFAQSTIVSDPTSQTALRPIEYWVEAVVDSSRYFVVRCEDLKSKRQAHVGIGFRERDESLNFKMGLEDFWRSMERERKALHFKPIAEVSDSSSSSDGERHLSLKEGEKIHITLKNAPQRPQRERSFKTAAVGKGGLLLKKPPPPAGSPNPEKPQISPVASPTALPPAPPTLPTSETKAETEAATKMEAGTPTTTSLADEEDDWGDFEG